MKNLTDPPEPLCPTAPLALVLVHPEIPPNTGNIIRLCANTGAELHLVEPLGFRWADKDLQRAGLDYHEHARVQRHADWAACKAALAGRRLFALTTKGSRRYDAPDFAPGDAFVFGRESAGLPADILAEFAPDARLRLPMRADSRSMNLANTAAVMLFEAWRQIGFPAGV